MKRSTWFISCALSLLCSSQAYSFTPFAADNYGECGNGVWERPPVEAERTNWQAEQCDTMGNPEYSSQACVYGTGGGKPGGCWLQPDRHDNGIIEYYNGEWEECDTFNDKSAWCKEGQLVGQYSYYNNALCGNGIIDDGERCDAGSNLNSIVCGASCNNNTPNDYKSYDCKTASLCGNLFIDEATGEQCDLGVENGQPGSICSSHCTLVPKNPTFDAAKIYTFPADTVIDHRWGGLGGTVPLDPRIPTTIMHIYDRARVIRIERAPDQQYSAIIPANQPFDFTAPGQENDILDVSFSMRRADTSTNLGFDNDYFGLAIGLPSTFTSGDNNNILKGKNDQKYLLVRMRDSRVGASGDYVSAASGYRFPSRCSFQYDAGTPYSRGLRLNFINGTPTVNEFWRMSSCLQARPTEAQRKNQPIVQIPTQYFQDGVTEPNLANKQNYTTSDFDAINEAASLNLSGWTTHWNKMVNPAFELTPYYYSQVINDSVGRAATVLQIRIRYTKDEIKVWLDNKLSIYVTSDILGKDWPKKGDWGFFFLGMDDFIADFRSPENRLVVDPLDWLDDKKKQSLETPVGIRCGYCGDGVTDLNPGETCDGGTLGVPGCKENCTIEDHWACENSGTSPLNPSKCFTAKFVTPSPTSTTPQIFTTTTPLFTGTYEGSKPKEIKVFIKPNSGGTACEGEANITDDGKWSYQVSASCNLLDSKTYEVHAKATLGKKGILFIGKESATSDPGKSNYIPIKIDTTKIVTIDEPSGNPDYTTKQSITLSGTCNQAFLLSFGRGSETIQCPKGTWSKQIRLPNNSGNNIVKASIGSTELAEKTIVVDQTNLDAPPVYSTGENVEISKTLHASNGHVVIEGTKDSYKNNPSPVKVTVTLTNQDTGKSETGTAWVDQGTGKYRVELPIPNSHHNNSYTITATASDKAGNTPAKTTIEDVHVLEGTILRNHVTFLEPKPQSGPYTYIKLQPTSNTFVVKVKIGPQAPTAGNFRFSKCTNNIGDDHPKCDPGNPIFDTSAYYCGSPGDRFVEKSMYDQASGICTITLTTKEIFVGVLATEGKSCIPGPCEPTNVKDVSQSYILDKRDIAKLPITVEYNGSANPTNNEVTGPNLTVKVSLNEALLGDKAVVTIGNVEKECKVMVPKGSGTGSCEVTFPMNDPTAPIVGRDGHFEVATKVISGTGDSTGTVTKNLGVSPTIQITHPKDGDILAPNQTISGIIDCGNDTSCPADTKVQICSIETNPKCTIVPITVIGSGAGSKGWHANIPANLPAGQSFDKTKSYKLTPVKVDTASGGNNVTIAYPGITVGIDPDMPIIINPCRTGQPGCNSIKNTSGEKIHIEATGPAGKKAKVTAFGQDGKELNTSACDGKTFSGNPPSISCDIYPIDKNGNAVEGPYIIKVQADPDNNGPTATTPPIHIFTNNKPVIVSPCNATAPGCIPDNNTNTDPKTGNPLIHIDISGPAGAGVTVTITDKDGKTRTVKCGNPASPTSCKYDATGHFIDNIPTIDDNGEPMEGPYVIHATTTDIPGQGVCKPHAKCETTTKPIYLFPPSSTTNPSSSAITSKLSQGIVAGGCGCSSTPLSESLVSLLIAALGLIGLRRRRKEA